MKLLCWFFIVFALLVACFTLRSPLDANMLCAVLATINFCSALVVYEEVIKL